MSKSTIAIGIIVLLFLVGVVIALNQLGDAGSREVVNKYRTAEYGFTYPLGLEIEEYPNGSLAIGSTTADGFSSVVNLTVVEIPADAQQDSDVFRRAQVVNLCAADAPRAQVSCTIETERSGKNAEGENMQEHMLTLTRTGAEPLTSSYGPVYSYVIALEQEGQPTRHALLLVHAPLSAALAGQQDTTLLTRINDSLTIGPSRR